MRRGEQIHQMFLCLRQCLSFEIQAGPGRCALASKGSTAGDISRLIEDLLATLYERPLAVHNSTRPGPLTASTVRGKCAGPME